MEKIQKSFPSKPIHWPASRQWALAGVVGSGNLEVLIEPTPSSPDSVEVVIETSIAGYEDSWLAAIEHFATHYAVGGTLITIHDQGAVPVVIMMRLRQALSHLTNP